MRFEDPKIRPYSLDDADAVSEICFLTDYMGKPVRSHFKDQHLFYLLHARPCLDFDPEQCFVAEVNAKVVGYCLAVRDTSAYRTWFAESFKKNIVRRLLTKQSGDIRPTLSEWPNGAGRLHVRAWKAYLTNTLHTYI